MIVLATKREFIIGAIFALLLTLGRDMFTYSETLPKGGLSKIEGVLKIEKTGRFGVPSVVGRGRTGVCVLHVCKIKQELDLLEGQTVTVKLDSLDHIYEITSNGNTIFGEIDLHQQQQNIKFRSGFIAMFLIFCFVLLDGSHCGD